MLSKLFSSASILFLCLTLSAQIPDITSPQLSSADVEAFIKNFPDIQKDFDAAEMDYDNNDDYQSLIEALGDANQVNEIVQKYGYKDYMDFAVKTWSITTCYATLTMESEGMPSIQEAIAEIEANPNLTAEQKELSKQQLQVVYSTLSASVSAMSNAEDLETVKGYIDELNTLFENQ